MVDVPFGLVKLVGLLLPKVIVLLVQKVKSLGPSAACSTGVRVRLTLGDLARVVIIGEAVRSG